MTDAAPSSAQSWKVTLPCTRAEAEALDGDIAAFALMDRPPVLMTSEAAPDDENAWQLDAYFEGEPSPAAIRLLRTLVPSASGTIWSATAAAEPLEEPPGVCAGLSGLRVFPGCDIANSAVTVLPMITAPAFLSSATHAASARGRCPE